MPLKKFPKNYKRIAVLIDPEKFDSTGSFIEFIRLNNPDYIFVGGSGAIDYMLFKNCVQFLKDNLSIPIILFPGDHNQITDLADGLLVLSILQSNQASLICSKLIDVAEKIESSSLETIATSYILIDGGKKSSTEKFTKVDALAPGNFNQFKSLLHTSNILNFQATYLEAGSGAIYPVASNLISMAKNVLSNQTLIVGGGIRSASDAENAWNHGADIIVVGNYLETNPEALKIFCSKRNELNKQ